MRGLRLLVPVSLAGFIVPEACPRASAAGGVRVPAWIQAMRLTLAACPAGTEDAVLLDEPQTTAVPKSVLIPAATNGFLPGQEVVEYWSYLTG